ncbi:hypothetical protein NGRA_1320 [Nosema granulosis]|uniref:Uncharacterized protein n=1 Tax=Nosema granulosis TaxID=83296 RepID=A0A9P6H1D7_9MICR|nr:hypothetical protein NGRA_1320 [Nosema granulosis]
MSRFFDDIEEEKKEIKKKIYNESTPKINQKLSKKEKLFLELQTRVFDLEDDESKKSEKNIKKFLSDLKKYESSYEELPSFLKDFLLSHKVYVKGNKKVVDAFLSQYQEKEVENIQQKLEEVAIRENRDEAVLKNEFCTIKEIEDLAEKKSALFNFLNRIEDSEMKIDVLVILLSTCVRLRDRRDLFRVLSLLVEFRDCEKVNNILKKNLDLYLDITNEEMPSQESINSSIDGSINSSINSSINLLENFKDINPVVCDRRMLEIEYFYRNNFIETEYLDFKLFVALKNRNNEKTKLIFSSIIQNLREDQNFKEDLREIESIVQACVCEGAPSGPIYKDKVFQRIIKEFGYYSYSNQMYSQSFISFLYLRTLDVEYPNVLFTSLFIVLSDSLVESKKFREFLTQFREFSNNPLVLQSEDKINEVYRAFYCLNTYDVDGCYNILRSLNITWDDKNKLIELAKAILYK